MYRYNLNMKSYIVVVLSLLVASSSAGPHGLKTDPNSPWRIVGGSDASEGLYPHQISLQLYGKHKCGGSIVGSEWVITAAHCVRDSSQNAMRVVVGINKLSVGGELHEVREIHIHEGHNPKTGENDVAILKVQPITFNDLVAPIVAEKEEIEDDAPVILTGWGALRYGGDFPDQLQQIELKISSRVICALSHIMTRPVLETNVCTFTKYGEGVCNGDSGGPLIREKANSVRTLVGIASWGEPCARGFPDVFSKTSSYVDWFNKKCNNCL